MAIKYPQSLIEAVQKDILSGMQVDAAVRKYGVSKYFVKKWAGIVYCSVDLHTLVRHSYRDSCLITRDKIEVGLSQILESQKCELSPSAWDRIEEIIKDNLYDFAETVVRHG